MGGSVVVQARCPVELRTVGRAIGVNLSEAAIRGILRAVCATAGINGHETLSPDLEIALLTVLRSRRDELAAELEELNNYIQRIEGFEEGRRQRQVEAELEVCRHQQQQAEIERIRDAKARFDAVLHDLSDQDLAPIQAAIEGGDLGDVTATTVTRLLSRYNLTMPAGSDPEQWLVDFVVARRGVA